jgi:hypothetical protein
VALVPSSGGDARGAAIFGRTGDQSVLTVRAINLPEAKSGAYVLWLMTSETEGIPLGRIPPNKKGQVLVQIPVPAPLQTAILPNVRFVDLSESSVAAVEKSLRETQAEISRTQQSTQPQAVQLPKYSGTSVLRGSVPACKSN